MMRSAYLPEGAEGGERGLATEAAAKKWQVTMDTLMRNDPADYELKCQLSRRGGRAFSPPSALLARIAAARRAGASRGA
eukprot:8672189-Pyramimonas_sp.AAC.1